MENLIIPMPRNGRSAMEEELMKGRGLANQLLEVLNEEKVSKSELLSSSFAEDLVREVLKSFTNTLLLLNTPESNHVVAPITVTDLSLDGACNSDLNSPLNTKNSNKRKRSFAPTWEKNTSILIDDGHAWRKYGQKRITNTKHLRSYYRCTHKSDQHCQAIKHVQRIQEDPPLYRTTYYGHHTCTSSLYSHIYLEPVLSSESSTLLSFNKNIPSKQESSISSPLLESTKREPMEVTQDQDDHFAQNQLFSSDLESLLLWDFEVFDYLEHPSVLSLTESVKYENIYDHFTF